MKPLKFILIIVCFVSMSCFVGVGCKPQEVIIDNDSIIGKWQLIGQGYNDRIEYRDFISGVISEEFTSDGWWIRYENFPNPTFKFRYRIDKKNIYVEIAENERDVYEYKFYGDKVRLKIVGGEGSITDTNVYIFQKVE